MGISVCVHALAIIALASAAPAIWVLAQEQHIDVRIINPPLSPVPTKRSSKPLRMPAPQRYNSSTPPPSPVPTQATVTTTTPTPAPGPSSSVVVPPSPQEATPAASSPPAPQEVAVSPPRYDAAYLQNPHDIYPAQSLRNGEEGTVLLRVRVSIEGQALDVTTKQSSGFPRLDNAAKAIVRTWRFIPARRGNEALEAVVDVPYEFKLDP